MIKTYELINGTLKEVVQGNEPIIKIEKYFDGLGGLVEVNWDASMYIKIKLLDKSYSDTGKALMQGITQSSGTDILLGTYTEPAELKGIEVVNVLTEDGVWILRSDVLPVTGNYTVTLIDRNYCNDLDLFVKDTEGIKVLCLGHWNDGIVL
jgi:hypothetical protein